SRRRCGPRPRPRSLASHPRVHPDAHHEAEGQRRTSSLALGRGRQSVPSREARATTTVGTADPDGGVRAKEPPVSDYALISRTARAAQRLWGVSLVRGAVAIAVGVFLLIDAAATFTVLVWLLGALLVVDGLVATVGALRSPKDEAGA